MNTILISIGASKYDSGFIPDLFGANKDVRRVNESFNLWGIKKQNIITLTGLEATRANIINAIRVQPLKIYEKIDTIIFYYAGHGEQSFENGNLPEYILYCYDTDPKDAIGTSINIKDIVSSLERLKPTRIFLFIDACYVRLIRFPRIDPSAFKIDKSLIGNYCFFALLSSWGEESFESKKGGLFTCALLRSLAKLRQNNANCIDLAKATENELRINDYPLPMGYWYGASNVWILDGIIPTVNYGQNYLKRINSLVSIYDQIVLNDSDAFCFYGNALSGKTILAIQLCEYFESFVYTSIKAYDSIDRLKISLSKKLLQKFILPGKEINEDNFESIISFLISYNMDFTLVLDHAEKINENELNEFIEYLVKKGVHIVMFSRVPYVSSDQIMNLKIPPLSKEEFSYLFNRYNQQELSEATVYELYVENASKNFIEIVNILSKSFDNIFVKYSSEVQIICECDGFIDELLFCEVFDFSISSIIVLVNEGYIRKSNNRYIPHDSLFDFYDINKDAVLSSKNALKYWLRQFNETPNSSIAYSVVIEQIKANGVNWIESVTVLIRLITGYSIKKNKWDDLELFAIYLIEYDIKDLFLQACEKLAHVARDYIFSFSVSELFQNDSLVLAEERDRYLLAKSEKDFWKGNFQESIITCNEVLQSNTIKDKLYFTAHLNIGISYFFLGIWPSSKNHLDLIDDEITDNKLLGWKKLIYGTILAIRGEDFEKGITMLEESIELFSKVEDFVGLGIAYCNTGECYFKKRNMHLSKYYLDKAESVSLLANDPSTTLEVLRNKLLLEINTARTYSAEAKNIVSLIDKLICNSSDNCVLMQVYNTYATVCAYNYDLTAMSKYIDLANKLTESNLEYSIYTNINKAIYYYIIDNIIKFDYFLNQVYQLAIDGKNTFALLQCLNDIDNITLIYDKDKPPELEILVLIRKKVYDEENND